MKHNSVLQQHTDSSKPNRNNKHAWDKNRATPSGCSVSVCVCEYVCVCLKAGSGDQDQTGLGRSTQATAAHLWTSGPRTELRKQTALLRLFLFPSAAIVHLKLRELWERLHIPVIEKTALSGSVLGVSALKASVCVNRFA